MYKKKSFYHATQFGPARQSKSILDKNKKPLLAIIVAMLNGDLVIVNQEIIWQGTTPSLVYSHYHTVKSDIY